jgi:hypothetical protein
MATTNSTKSLSKMGTTGFLQVLKKEYDGIDISKTKKTDNDLCYQLTVNDFLVNLVTNQENIIKIMIYSSNRFIEIITENDNIIINRYKGKTHFELENTKKNYYDNYYYAFSEEIKWLAHKTQIPTEIPIKRFIEMLVDKFVKVKSQSNEIMISTNSTKNGIQYAILTKEEADETYEKKYMIEKWEDITKNREAMREMFSVLVDNYFDDFQ